MMKNKIILSAVMYSPNIGDGVIADCFSATARTIMPGLDLTWLDIAGRRGYGDAAASGRMRTVILEGLACLPAPLAQVAARQIYGYQVRRHLQPKLGAVLDSADGLIMGGGQLLADANLNFPIKIAAVARAARARRLPVAIQGVGVGAGWSASGIKLFGELFNNPALCFISVRDEASKTRLDGYLARIGVPHPEVQVYPDAGLLAAEVVAAPTHISRSTPLIGIGVTHPVVLHTHGEAPSGGTVSSFIARYLELAGYLVAEGVDVAFFTNGSGDDEALIARIAQTSKFKAFGERAKTLPCPKEPKALMKTIASFDALVSHRMHANIIAYSYRVPHIGLTWDQKIEAFFTLTGRTEALYDGTLADPKAIAAVVRYAVDEIIAVDRHHELLAAARNGVTSAVNFMNQ